MKTREWLVKSRGVISQQEVADKSGINRSFYTQIESGKRNPSVYTAKKIANTLGLDWTIFFGNECGDSHLKTERSEARIRDSQVC